MLGILAVNVNQKVAFRYSVYDLGEKRSTPSAQLLLRRVS